MSSFAPKGHARVDPRRPQAFAICDRCGFQYNHNKLVWDSQYHGREIRRTGFLVCESCNDIPNPTLRPIVLPPDPVPILNPRKEPIHCHTFKPRVDQLSDVPLDGFPRSITADTISGIWPPIDDTTPVPVTVDRGSVCDTRRFPGGFPPDVVIPIPPQPPIDPGDATVDHEQPTADATGTTVDAGPITPPVEIESNTADTTLISADDGIKLTNVFPDYDAAADGATEMADATVPTADYMFGDIGPPPVVPPPTVVGNTGDVTMPTSDTSQKLTNVMLNYDAASDETTEQADETVPTGDYLGEPR